MFGLLGPSSSLTTLHWRILKTFFFCCPNRRQFPAAPVNPPVIPSWQLKQEVTSSHQNGVTSSNDNDVITNGGGSGDTLHSGSRRELEESGDEDEHVLNNGDSNGVEIDVLTPSATHVLSV